MFNRSLRSNWAHALTRQQASEARNHFARSLGVKRSVREASDSEDADDDDIYIFRLVDDVFDAVTLRTLREQYDAAEANFWRLPQRSSADGTYVWRDGRYDIALGVPRSNILTWAIEHMHADVDDESIDAADTAPRLMTGVRALVVPRATGAQQWHADRYTDDVGVRYLTLVVALEDAVDDDGATEFLVPDELPPDGILRATEFNPEPADVDDPRLSGRKFRLKANQGILFDGRIYHRGSAATKRRGPIVYMVITNPQLEANV